eukprot:CAMPEP_0168625214 /NCGR_PEP_ID=MMETSP0449_2-20121227/9873_1 /TAXON_ID=1082188 /ORGANISM="Strombidium rassoulzadegani, Strain ras09" /LENGTH=261 /DNA_ID=CAMNT_0008666915 /DNA_START=79 /DNA_END=864 /DNA_ORIENTATION=+
MAALVGASSIAAVANRATAFTGKTVRARNVRSQARVTMAADRPVWYPGNDAPSYLDGSLVGDYGFDPLGLGSDPEILKWFVQAELIHGRWAMAGVAGILIPGVAAKVSGADFPQWYDAGKVYVENHPETPFGSLLFTQLFMMGWVETKRLMDFKNPGSQNDPNFDDKFGISEACQGMGNGYPGGKLFDPFGFSKGDAAKLEEYKVKEIKNGRLAMVAFFGFICQHAATGKGPVDNLFDHIADPYNVTFATNGVSVPHWTQF